MVDVEGVKSGFASGRLDMARFTLIMYFLVEQRWHYFIDKAMEPDGLTTKQWLTLIVVATGFKTPPSIQDVAEAMSTTHQNVKQIAAGLERGGFMTLDRDPDNRRIIRLKVTDKCFAMFRKREDEDVKTMLRMFENLSDDEVKALFNIIAKMESQAEQLYREAKTRRTTAYK